MVKKLLIANRGEIALRIIRACKELDIETIAVHSEADVDSLHVKLADESVCIGPPSPKLSYLNTAAIISAAEVTDADAIHPGYGFLSENAEFAKICEQCNILFIGPRSETISKMGDKIRAREIAKAAGVPLLEGSPGPVKTLNEVNTWAEKIGFPVMLKASAGGGGRGIQIVYESSKLSQTYEKVKSEAAAAFGNSDIYIEKYLISPRHVEIQVIGDKHGSIVHLGERDCTIQRRHQKVLEESPSPALDDFLRKKMTDAALKLARAVKYQSAGTIEFLLDNYDKSFYFIEMNTRIQVEHPVTEMVTGVDLMKEMITVAMGKKLSFKQNQIRIKGHSIECRINAEDPVNFHPSPGKITSLHLPGGPGVRIDSFIYDQYTIPPYYDSLLGKLIVHAEDRPGAIKRMNRCLEEFFIEGISNNIPFHLDIIQDPRFKSGVFDTNFLKNRLKP